MRIHLLDPGLKVLAGHHFDLDQGLSRYLVEQGHDLHVYAHIGATQQVQTAVQAVAPITPLFRSGPYVDPRQQDPYAGEFVTYQTQSRLLAEDLVKLPDADIWVWPTLTAAQLHASATRNTGAGLAGCVHMPVVSDEYPQGQCWWRDAFLTAQRAGVQLNLGAIEPEHRYEYLPLMPDSRFSVFPSYFEGVAPQIPRKQLRKIGFFGNQRGEKGAALIMDILGPLLSAGYQVVVHDSGGMLRFENRPGLTMLGFVDDLHQEIAQCDLIVLPYQPDRYKSKASGIMMDAIASGIPTVVPFGTALGRWSDRTGAGTQFVQLQTTDIIAAINAARSRYDTIAQSAYDAAIAWQKNHGMARFAQAMLGPFLP
jgi:hypothetical protein